MEANQVLEVLKLIKGAYSRFEINEETPKMWFKFLKDENYDMVINRLDRHIRSSRFEPTIHDVITHRDPELEQRKVEIARNKWIAEGKNPDEFEYRPASND